MSHHSAALSMIPPHTTMLDDKAISTIEVAELPTHQSSFNRSSSLEDEKRLIKRLDSRLMPVLCALYLFACEYSTFVRSSQ